MYSVSYSKDSTSANDEENSAETWSTSPQLPSNSRLEYNGFAYFKFKDLWLIFLFYEPSIFNKQLMQVSDSLLMLLTHEILCPSSNTSVTDYKHSQAYLSRTCYKQSHMVYAAPFTPHQVLGDSTLLSRHSLLDLLRERETGEGFFNYLAPTYKLVLMLPRKWIRSSQKQRIESGTAFCVTTILGAIYVIYLGQGC